MQKPDGSVRITVDYKQLNRVIQVEQYPLPAINDLYAKLVSSKFFTKIDMKAAYHQIPIHPESIQYTALICEFGLFEYLAKPMGIKSAPAWFQRFINTLFNQYIEKQILSVYLDDILIFSPNLEDHIHDVSDVINTLKTHELKRQKSPN